MRSRDRLYHHVAQTPGIGWLDTSSALAIGLALVCWAAVAMSILPAAIQFGIMLGLVFPALFCVVWARDRHGLPLARLRADLALLAAGSCILLDAALGRILRDRARDAVISRRATASQASDRSTEKEKIELTQAIKFLLTPLFPARRPGARVKAAT